jgi:hypothetical protein
LRWKATINERGCRTASVVEHVLAAAGAVAVLIIGVSRGFRPTQQTMRRDRYRANPLGGRCWSRRISSSPHGRAYRGGVSANSSNPARAVVALTAV